MLIFMVSFILLRATQPNQSFFWGALGAMAPWCHSGATAWPRWPSPRVWEKRCRSCARCSNDGAQRGGLRVGRRPR